MQAVQELSAWRLVRQVIDPGEVFEILWCGSSARLSCAVPVDSECESAARSVGVGELVPPAVAAAGREKVNPHALPLDDFATEVMQLLSENSTPHEVLVQGTSSDPTPLRRVGHGTVTDR